MWRQHSLREVAAECDGYKAREWSCHPAARAMYVLPPNRPMTQLGGHNLNSNIPSYKGEKETERGRIERIGDLAINQILENIRRTEAPWSW